jgi:hypothetical protein
MKNADAPGAISPMGSLATLRPQVDISDGSMRGDKDSMRFKFRTCWSILLTPTIPLRAQ